MQTFNSKSIFNYTSKSDIIKISITLCSVFVLLKFIQVSLLMNNEDDSPFRTHVWNILCLPTNINTFWHQPWSLFTYFFLDDSFMRIVGNMVWLWIFGTVIEDTKGPNRVLPIFIMGGIAGGLFLLIYNAIVGSKSAMIYNGCTASIFAIAFATLLYKPKFPFINLFGKTIPIWILVIIFLILNILLLRHETPAFFMLLLGGTLIGLLYNNVFFSLFEKLTSLLAKSGSVIDNTNFVLKKERNVNYNYSIEDRYNMKKQETQKTVDAILEKIHQHGMQSLSARERKLLEQSTNQ